MIWREVKIRWRSMLLWASGFAFMIIGGMTKYDVFGTGSGRQLNQFVQSMPRLMRVMYGLEGTDISTFEGYFGLLLLYVLIMTALHGAFLGSSLLHLEFKERTADFLFVRPVSRDRLLLRKILGGLLVILALDAIVAACCWYVFSQADRLDLLPQTVLAAALTHLFFFALGFFLTIVLPKSRYGQQASLYIILLSYLSVSLSQLYDRPSIAALSPIGWYNANLYSAARISLTAAAVLLLFLLIGLLGAAVRAFRSKDIPG